MAELVEESTRTGVVADVAGRAGYPVLRHHAIARRGARGPELLRVTLPNGEEVLPLFSSEGMAQGFLRSCDLDGSWYARECYAGELVSMLIGLYADIDGVMLDPVDVSAVQGYAPETCIRWKSFVSYLLGDGRGVSFRPASQGTCAVAGAF